MKNRIYYWIMAGICLACDPVIDIELPKHDPKLVISSLLSTEDIIRIDVGKTEGILGASDYYRRLVSDARIEIRENGQLLSDPQAVKNCLDTQPDEYPIPCFETSFLPQPGSTYEITAYSDSFGTVTAKTTVPQIPVIRDIVYTPKVAAGSQGQTDLIQFTLVDPPEKNFYEIFALAQIAIQGQSTDRVFMFPLGAISPTQFELDYTEAKGLLDDELFNGQDHTISLYISVFGGTRNGEPIPAELEKLSFVVRSCDQAYYEYRNTVELHKQIENNEVAVFLLEPISVFSNIEGGYGIWASYATKRDTLF